MKKEVKQKLAITENDFNKAEKITSSDFNDLKQLIDIEVNSQARREQGYTISNDVIQKEKITINEINNLIGALNKIRQDYSSVLSKDIIFSDLFKELYIRVELLRTVYPVKVQTVYPDHAGCGGACRGLCSGCYGGCSDSCSNSCRNSCKNSCSGSCDGGCDGDCDSSCGGCGGCSDECTGCGSYCGGSCEGFSYSCETPGQ